MRALSETMSTLLPLASSRERFSDQKNAASILNSTENLHTIVKSLSNSSAHSDPEFKTMSGLFDEDINRALSALKSGNHEYARQILKDTTAYCIECHTQTNNGPDFPKLDLKINTALLAPFERAEFYTATRQFDLALTSYREALLAPKTKNSFAWENAARVALAITVRVRNSPDETMKFLEQISKSHASPPRMQKTMSQWQRDVSQWKGSDKQTKLSDTESKLKLAEQLLAKAQRRQKFPLDHSEDVFYFRAASLAHEILMKKDADHVVTARAMFVAGQTSEATRDMNFWTLHESLYEQCIRELPHSTIAQQCFKRLSDSITMGYTGSSGTNIPDEERGRMMNYSEMAK